MQVTHYSAKVQERETFMSLLWTKIEEKIWVKDMAQEPLAAERCTEKKISFFVNLRLCKELFSTLTWKYLEIIYNSDNIFKW